MEFDSPYPLYLISLNMIIRYPQNTKGRDLIVGDIHGHFTKLRARLDEVRFNPETDRLFSVGDLVDRGPESHDVIDWLKFSWFHPVQGNHEDMAIRWGKPDCRMDRENYMLNGGAWNIGNTPEERAEYSFALDALPLAIEIETEHGLVGVVHAEPTESWDDLRGFLLDPQIEKKHLKALRQCVLWDRTRVEGGYVQIVPGVRAVVVGHTPMKKSITLGNVIYIDTAGWHPNGSGFTLLDAKTLLPT